MTRDLTRHKNPPCEAFLPSKYYTKAKNSSHAAAIEQFLCAPMPCIPNESPKHTNPHFSIGKRKVRSRILCVVGPYWAQKSTLWAPSSFRIVYKTSNSSHTAAKEPFSCAPMPCIPNKSLKHTKPHFSIGKTEVRSRILVRSDLTGH